jgi:predicted small secreted protein
MKTSLQRLVLLFLTAGFLAMVGVGCQTTKGFGRDVEHVGDKIQGQ